MKYIVTNILLIIWSVNTWACSCPPPPFQGYDNFCEGASLDPNLSVGDTIVLAKIISFSSDSLFFEIEILEELKGVLSSMNYIVAGQDGMNCAVSFKSGQFSISDTLVLNLIPDYYGRIDTLELNSCSLSYLSYQNGVVLGQINPTTTSMDYLTFKQNINDCRSLSAQKTDKYFEVVFFPNPVEKEIIISFPDRNKINLRLQILNMFGQIVKESNITEVSKTINMSELQNGVYIIFIYKDDELLVSKNIVKK